MSAPGAVLGRMTRRPKRPDELFVRAVLTIGAKPLMRKSGFKRPGGGWTYYRERPWLEASPRLDAVSVEASYPGHRPSDGTFKLRLSMAARPGLTLATHELAFPLDLLGDARDLAVWVNHRLRTEGLPWFERPLDLEAIARAAEAEQLRWSRSDWVVHRVASLWRLADRPDEAARVETPPPGSPDDDAPF